ncbi:dTMP kinase [Hathewaya histolytica]|uniref:Thymidylate kinase n=1 Tax=Hathewaya histolytica TaxID=1498 RepID=A0A4U9QVS6_HATHI|nr:dTMP kinase [Hathewaya histolytica]VTQ82489.1 thymidylate kinase [Hathewaya histolytica]
MNFKGVFITLEGGEGVGKTTQIKNIEEYFKQNNISYISTREPGGIKISEKIREIILDKSNTDMDERTEALLYAAARRQHLADKVIPALKEGKIVICDRFIDSSLAYQGFARGIGMKEVLAINEFAIEECMPDLTIYLDIEPVKGIQRVKNRKGEINRLDLESLSFHEKVRQGYLKLLEVYPNRIKKISAEGTEEEVFYKIKELIGNSIKDNAK